MVMTLVEKGILLWTWIGKGEGVLLHDVRDEQRNLAFAKNTVRLGLAHGREKRNRWLIQRHTATKRNLSTIVLVPL